jgi:hypothetical protein
MKAWGPLVKIGQAVDSPKQKTKEDAHRALCLNAHVDA